MGKKFMLIEDNADFLVLVQYSETDKLKEKVAALGALVEERVQTALRALFEGDQNAAGEVIAGDDEVDVLEVEVEEECVKTLTLHRPIDMGLRFVVSALKINHDLERIGDMAVKLAEQVERGLLDDPGESAVAEGLKKMAEIAQIMLHDALDAFIRLDVEKAGRIRRDGRALIVLHRQMCANFNQSPPNCSDQFDRLLRLGSIAHALERIGAHATNIAEDVIFLIEGKIVRHRLSSDFKRVRSAGSGKSLSPRAAI